MRRSTFVYAPILAAAALTLPTASRAVAQQTAASTQQSSTTRNGFGASFEIQPWMYIAGGAAVSLIFVGSGS